MINIIDVLQHKPELWDLFTQKEEYNPSFRDIYSRFLYYMSKNRQIFEPIISEYLIQNAFHPIYPKGKKFAICLTHDIDVLYQSKITKYMNVCRSLQSKYIREVIKNIGQLRSKKIPWWNFYDIMALEDRYGAKSSFYFMVQDPDDPDYTYDIEDCETIMGELSDKDWEVGLHGGHTTYNDPNEMKQKKSRLEKVLNKKVFGYRNHYLRFQVPDTWENLSSAGFRYDTTFGYADCVGFRNGMCHPFKPFNLITGKEIPILEIPLVINDTALNSYMKLDAKVSWEVIRQLIDKTEKYKGTISILWHNTYMFGEQKEIYEKILRYGEEKEAWLTSGNEICKWHLKEQMK